MKELVLYKIEIIISVSATMDEGERNDYIEGELGWLKDSFDMVEVKSIEPITKDNIESL